MVIAYIAQAFVDPDSVSTGLGPSNSRTVRASEFTASIELLQYNGACDCANMNPELMPTISGFVPSGNFSCTGNCGLHSHSRQNRRQYLLLIMRVKA